MCIGKKIFFAVGALILIIVVSQGALTTLRVKGDLEQSAFDDLRGQTEGIVDNLSELVAQTVYSLFLIINEIDSFAYELEHRAQHFFICVY